MVHVNLDKIHGKISSRGAPLHCTLPAMLDSNRQDNPLTFYKQLFSFHLANCLASATGSFAL